jgi:hypothetical protein
VAIGTWNYSSLGFCVYDVPTNSYSCNYAPQAYGAAFSSDGQAAASEFIFTDNDANVIGRVGRPDIYYYYSGILTGPSAIQPLEEPQFNASGSLYFMAYPSFVEIIDVQHAFLRMRFSLSETVSNTAAPIAVDSGGRFIYLITNQGLTIVDLGEAPLSIGWVNPATAAPGTQVTVRGSGFNSSTTATVNGLAAAVSFTDENTLSLTIPGASAGPAVIVLTNSDGTTYTAATLLTVQ